MNATIRKLATSAMHVGCDLAVALALMVVLPAGCTAGQGLQLDPPWEVGEVSRLEVRRAESVLLQWELRVEDRNSQVVLVSEQKTEGYREYSAVFVDPETLVPSRTEFELETAQGRVVYTAAYAGTDVAIKAQTPGGPQDVKVKLPAGPYFDNEEFIMVLRALPLADGFKATLNDIVTRTASKAAITVQVVRRENVTVPAGTYDAWVVELKGISQYAWISASAPHELVKYENKQAGTVSELVRYGRR